MIPRQFIYNLKWKSAYHIATIWNIPIKIHISLFILLAYLALQAFFAGLQNLGLLGAFVNMTEVLILLVAFFCSICLHELGHSFVAIHKGCKVKEITMMLIGGAAKMEDIPRRPKDECLMAAAGPAVSLALALIFTGIFLLLPATQAPSPILAWIAGLLLFTAISNAILAIFNLLPAYPMDGGRILRAALTPRMGRLKATHIAVICGRAIAAVLGLIAIFGLPPILPAWNLPLLLVAGFVAFVGQQEYRQIQVETLMEQRGFSNRFGSPPPRNDPPPPPPIDDHTVLISPPPYSKGPYDRAHIEKISRKRFPFP